MIYTFYLKDLILFNNNVIITKKDTEKVAYNYIYAPYCHKEYSNERNFFNL